MFSRKAGNKEASFEFRFNKQHGDKDVWEVTRAIDFDGKKSSEKKSVFFAGNDTVVFDDEFGTLSIHKEPQDK
jgi:hypothetical protein